ncbi:MAG: SagB/ThcOx family dehydrogenase [Demequinaceae bacterium]|nr:SagB/ThcOx family dehydrogenase [Demequinaceae bacterium]
MTENLFDDYWEASSLDSYGARDYAAALSAYKSDDKETSLAYPGAPVPLPQPRSRLGKLAASRRSGRAFTGGPVSADDVGAVLASLRAVAGPERRTYASAGASYPVETFLIEFATGAATGAVSYYDAVRHGLVPLKRQAPAWSQAWTSLGFASENAPAILILGIVFPQRVTEKYGPRGERFALIEAGSMLQMLGLAVAERSRLAGLALGGVYDRHWLEVLGLPASKTRIAFGYLVGPGA